MQSNPSVNLEANQTWPSESLWSASADYERLYYHNHVWHTLPGFADGVIDVITERCHSSSQIAYAFHHSPTTSSLFYHGGTNCYIDDGNGEYVWEGGQSRQTAYHGYGFDEYPGGFISIKLQRRIYPTKIIITEDSAQYAKNFRIYASNDNFVNSKVLLHESIDNSLNTMDTIIETGANIKGITIDLNNVQNNYADHYENGTHGSVNYNDCYDLFVLIVQKATSSYFNLGEFSVRGQPACMVPGTEFCQVCWTPPPPPPPFWEGASFGHLTVIPVQIIIVSLIKSKLVYIMMTIFQFQVESYYRNRCNTWRLCNIGFK